MKKIFLPLISCILLLTSCNSESQNYRKNNGNDDVFVLDTKNLFTKYENLKISAVFDAPGKIFNENNIVNSRIEMYRKKYRDQFLEGKNQTTLAKFTREEFYSTFRKEEMTNVEIVNFLESSYDIESITFNEDNIEFCYINFREEMYQKTDMEYIFNQFVENDGKYIKKLTSSENDLLFFFINYPEGFVWDKEKHYATYDLNRLPNGTSKYFSSAQKDYLSSLKLYLDVLGRPLKVETGKIPFIYNLSTVINFEYGNYSFVLPTAEYEFNTNGCEHKNTSIYQAQMFEKGCHYIYCNDCYSYINFQNCELDNNLHCNKCGLDLGVYENIYDGHGVKIDALVSAADGGFLDIYLPLVGLGGGFNPESYEKPSFVDINETLTNFSYYDFDDGYTCYIYHSYNEGIKKTYFDYLVIYDASKKIETLYKFCVGQKGYTDLLDSKSN